MKRLVYQVSVGKPSKLYKHCIASVDEYCKQHDIDHIVQTQPILRIKPNTFLTNRSKESYEKYGGFLPIYEKENAFGYFDRYDQIAIIDADIWIRQNSPNIFDELDDTIEFAGVVEREMPLTQKYFDKITNYSRMQYSSLNHVDWKWNQHGAEFYNMGMMLMNNSIAKYLNGETPLEFLRRSKFEKFIDGMGAWKWSTDQTLLNTWVKEEKMKTKNLDWKWNALYNAIPNDKLKQAHFVHFFHKIVLPHEGENIEELMKLV
jgi:hypothetical protein